MAFSCDCCGEQHSFRNCQYNVEAYGHIEDYNLNQQQIPSWYDQQTQNIFYHNDFVAADMPWQCCPQQEPSNFMDPELARLNALMRESTVAMNNLLHADMSWQYSPQQEVSNSKDDEFARLEALVREATHDMNSMLQQSTYWDTEILMQEVKEQCQESSPICGAQSEPPNQEHVDDKECPSELQQQIAMANIGEPEQRNAMTTPSEAEKSNASANSTESDAENVTTTLMLKHESVNCSYPELPRHFHEYMLDHQDDACLGDDTSSMVIPSDNGAARKSLLMEMIEKSVEISGYMLEDFKKDGPSLDLHRILANDCHDNWLELPRQRRLHPTMMEVKENEMEGIHGLQGDTKEIHLHGSTKGSNGEHIGPTLHGEHCHPMEGESDPGMPWHIGMTKLSENAMAYSGGSLLYLTASRPDIMFSVCLCARFQANPKESHLKAVKRIFRYLLDTPSLGLWYPRDSTFDLHAYSDADYGGSKIDRKSTSGTCQFLGNMLISWFLKKQNSVALSTTEAEYISAGSCCAQVLWMKQQLLDYGIDVGTIPIKCDNTSAICLTKNPIDHSRTKHIEIRHHFIRDHVSKYDIC
ncbi:hypothetical protein GQ457_14G005130 [Hibiscus cannabinus]